MYSSKPKPMTRKKAEPTMTKAKAKPKAKPKSNTAERLREHAKKHSAKHMAKMRKILKEGKSFAQAHAMATKMVGE